MTDDKQHYTIEVDPAVFSARLHWWQQNVNDLLCIFEDTGLGDTNNEPTPNDEAPDDESVEPT